MAKRKTRMSASLQEQHAAESIQAPSRSSKNFVEIFSAKGRIADRQMSSGPGEILAGFHQKGRRFATVDHVLDPVIPTKMGCDLSVHELQRLTLRRITCDRNFVPFYMLGAGGPVTKQRALKEVKALTALGRHIMALDQEYVAAALRRRRLVL